MPVCLFDECAGVVTHNGTLCPHAQPVPAHVWGIHTFDEVSGIHFFSCGRCDYTLTNDVDAHPRTSAIVPCIQPINLNWGDLFMLRRCHTCGFELIYPVGEIALEHACPGPPPVLKHDGPTGWQMLLADLLED